MAMDISNIDAVQARIDELDDRMMESPARSFGLMIERALLDIRWCTLKKRDFPKEDRWHKREAEAKKDYHALCSSEWIANIERWHLKRTDRKAMLADMDEVLGLKRAEVVQASSRFDGDGRTERGSGSG